MVVAPVPQKMEGVTAEQTKEDLDAMLGSWEQQTCDVVWGCPVCHYVFGGTETFSVDEQGRYTRKGTSLVNEFSLWTCTGVYPLILLSKSCGMEEPVLGRAAALKWTDVFTVEEAMAPRTITLAITDACCLNTNLTIQSTPIDRYTHSVIALDANGKPQGKPTTITISPDFKTGTQTRTVEGCQGACTCVPCPYTQTSVWKKK